MTEPRRTTPRTDERPSHPPLRAFLLVTGVVLAIVLLAVISTFGLL